MNELLLISQLVIFYAMVVFAYRFFGIKGLMCWTVVATIAANIEVLVQIEAFGMNMTLGNIMFASTFAVTDVLSEVAGKKTAQKAVNIGIATAVAFIIITQSWLLFQPNEYDFAMPFMQAIFSNTPRLMLTGLVVYAIVQRFDVWLYHRIWELTSKSTGRTRPYLWVRNNGSTLVSQALNAVLFTFGAFYGVFETEVLFSIIVASYIIFMVTSLADTPVVYLCRYMKSRGMVEDEGTSNGF